MELAQALLALSTNYLNTLPKEDYQEVLQRMKRMNDEVIYNLLTEFSQVSLDG